MFHHVVSQLITDPAAAAAGLPALPAPLVGQALFDSIYSRLEGELPPGPYLSDKAFAKILGVSSKTLCNLRSVKPLRYPRPIRIGDCRERKHVRAEILHWLAHEETEARTLTVHRCR
jgi:predicted DNA-binding transcriptional regulator AlpA